MECFGQSKRVIRAVARLIVIVGLLGCTDSKDSGGRVLLVGIDGATLRVAAPLIEEGKLPNLATLAREGVGGTLRSAQPMSSPRLWNTIATGKVPEKHGIVSFAYDGKDGTPHLFLSSDRRVHALWNIVSAAGLSVGVVNWWSTYPPERIEGVMVSDHLIAAEIENRQRMTKSVADPPGAVVFPGAWQPRITALMERDKPVTQFEDPFLAWRQLPRWVHNSAERLSRRFWEDGLVVRIALDIQKKVKPDLLMVFLPGIDRVSHFLWGTLEPPEVYPPGLRPSPSQRKAGASTLRGYYEYTDALIGLLMAGYGPADLVMVVSDHGFEAGVALMQLTGIHDSEKAMEGVLFARGPGIPPGGSPGSISVNDVTPTVLAWLGLPLAQDMDGRPGEFLQVPPVEMIATYDTGEIERLSTAPSGAEEKIVEQLRGLGYLE